MGDAEQPLGLCGQPQWECQPCTTKGCSTTDSCRDCWVCGVRVSLGQGQRLCLLGSWVQADMGGRGGLCVPPWWRLRTCDNQNKNNQGWETP